MCSAVLMYGQRMVWTQQTLYSRPATLPCDCKLMPHAASKVTVIGTSQAHECTPARAPALSACPAMPPSDDTSTLRLASGATVECTCQAYQHITVSCRSLSPKSPVLYAMLVLPTNLRGEV